MNKEIRDSIVKHYTETKKLILTIRGDNPAEEGLKVIDDLEEMNKDMIACLLDLNSDKEKVIIDKIDKFFGEVFKEEDDEV